MTEILIIGIAALALVGFVGGKGYMLGIDHEQAKIAALQVKVEAAQAKIQQDADAKHLDDQKHLEELAEANTLGHDTAKTVYIKVQEKGVENATRVEFITAPCVMSNSVLDLLNSARASLSTADDTSGLVRALSGSGATDGRQVLNPVPTGTQGHAGAVEGVRQQAPRSGAGDAVPGSGAGAVPAGSSDRPKPRPIGQ